MRFKHVVAAVLCAGVLGQPLAATANTVIDFTGVTYTVQPAPMPLPPVVLAFTDFSQSGFTVTADQTGWEVAPLFGNAEPDIFWANRTLQPTGSASVSVSYAGATFSFVGLDLASAARGPSFADYVVTGFLNGTQVFTQSGSVAGNGPLPPFSTVVGTAPSAVIDSLTITVLNSSSGIAHLDNITLGPSPVPEPAQAGMFAVGALMLAAWQRRSRRDSGAIPRK